MAEMQKKSREDKVKIANEVIATIAGIAASEVEDVTSMSGGMADGIASILGRKNITKGVKVEIGEETVAIEISIVVEYGCKIHEVAREVQKRVREAVEVMTGLSVVEVAINVLGVNMDKAPKKQEKETVLSEEVQNIK